MFRMVLSGDGYLKETLIDGEVTTEVSRPRVNSFFARVLQGLENIPGVESVAAVKNPPLSHRNSVRPFTIDGVDEQPPRSQRVVFA